MKRVKRETGENPVRTRHCERGAAGYVSLDFPESGKAAGGVDLQPGDLPAARESGVTSN